LLFYAGVDLLAYIRHLLGKLLSALYPGSLNLSTLTLGFTLILLSGPF
jgi:hypothetical protein